MNDQKNERTKKKEKAENTEGKGSMGEKCKETRVID